MVAIPYTLDELRNKLPALRKSLEEYESQEHYKPLPPMTIDEAEEFFWSLIDKAGKQVLSKDDCLMCGQLLAVYKQAVMADTLGKKGRFMVVHESEIQQLIDNL